jgi:hypothetical protein
VPTRPAGYIPEHGSRALECRVLAPGEAAPCTEGRTFQKTSCRITLGSWYNTWNSFVSWPHNTSQLLGLRHRRYTAPSAWQSAALRQAPLTRSRGTVGGGVLHSDEMLDDVVDVLMRHRANALEENAATDPNAAAAADESQKLPNCLKRRYEVRPRQPWGSITPTQRLRRTRARSCPTASSAATRCARVNPGVVSDIGKWPINATSGPSDHRAEESKCYINRMSS